MIKVKVVVGWFRKQKDQYIVYKASPTTSHPNRFEVWFARDTFKEVEATLSKRCKRQGYKIVDA